MDSLMLRVRPPFLQRFGGEAAPSMVLRWMQLFCVISRGVAARREALISSTRRALHRWKSKRPTDINLGRTRRCWRLPLGVYESSSTAWRSWIAPGGKKRCAQHAERPGSATRVALRTPQRSLQAPRAPVSAPHAARHAFRCGSYHHAPSGRRRRRGRGSLRSGRRRAAAAKRRALRRPNVRGPVGRRRDRIRRLRRGVDQKRR